MTRVIRRTRAIRSSGHDADEVQPAPAAYEVRAIVVRHPQATREVEPEDENVERVSEGDDLFEVGVAHEDRQEQVDDRKDSHAEDEDLPRHRQEDLAVLRLGPPGDVVAGLGRHPSLSLLFSCGNREG